MASRAEQGGGNLENSLAPFGQSAMESNEQMLWAEVYGRQYPRAEEIADLSLDDLRDVVTELRDEVGLIEEETGILVRNTEALRGRQRTIDAAAAAAPSSTRRSCSAVIVGEESAASEPAGAEGDTSQGSPPPARRGQAYRRRSVDTGDAYVTLEDRVMMLTKERERLKQQKERDERDVEHLRNLLAATVEEAVSRMKELHLEQLKFQREVIDEKGQTSADDLLRYMTNRDATQAKYLDKLNVQCVAAERGIVQSQQHLRQRHAAGEAFHTIDFEQLRIENQQFNERIERKNLELVELKGTSTRTVQTLNTLMDALNNLTAEQTRLRKDYKNRCEYLGRLQREMVSVTREADAAERKNAVIKAQHEAVRVPKIEHYVAQKAEEYELLKAEKNWKRKVEIAEGQLQLKQQRIRLLAIATDPNRRRFRIGKQALSGQHARDSPVAPAEPEVQLHGGPIVGGSKALLNKKRHTT